MSDEDDLLTPPMCRRCGGATRLRYISYAGMPGGGADLSWICNNAEWVNGFPQPCQERI